MGEDPRVVVTTTPRPIQLIRMLLADPTVVVTRGRTVENRDNLAPAFLEQIVRHYEGTRLGRQELDAEILEDVPGALWSRAIIEAARVRRHARTRRDRRRDRSGRRVGRARRRNRDHGRRPDANGHGYVLADVSGRYAPAEWARAAITAYYAHAADRIVAEINNGGEMVEATLRMIDPNVPFRAVRAARGKTTRAEPVAALYEQGRVRHVGAFPRLEDQMCAFAARAQGNFDRAYDRRIARRVDALVWAITELLVEPRSGDGIFEAYRRLAAKENETP